MIRHNQLRTYVDRVWREEVTPCLIDYIRIPNLSPAFEPDWERRGHMERAVGLLGEWARAKLSALPGATLEVLRAAGKTPLIVIDVPGTRDETVLLYGHLDKQPEMTGWSEGKGPWIPVLEGDKLYGRGGADDGYAIFAAVTALLALQEQDIPHARCVILIEASEESGSPDLPAYVEILASRLARTGLVICLDSGCGDYERLWLTNSLRGLIGGVLRVDVLKEGVHSGDASGVVPSSFRVLRQLLNRLENVETGQVLPRELYGDISDDCRRQARIAAEVLGESLYRNFPFVTGGRPTTNDLTELVLNRTWRPALSVTGLDGAPPTDKAGSVLRPFTAARLSMRLPPDVDAKVAGSIMKEILEANPPYGAQVRFEPDQAGSGWSAPPIKRWLLDALQSASHASWGNPLAIIGEGGTIPFMAMLGRVFPQAQFVVTGVLGPNSNAHGPNEFLHIPTGRRVTEVIVYALAAHADKQEAQISASACANTGEK
jgi:acetylornithine deacetylase/succinyl-diaminopimelate desuccinylase-like protein